MLIVVDLRMVVMGYDEHEMLIEYSEMTAFNFNSKEYLEVKNDYLECKNTATGLELLAQNFLSRFRRIEAI